MRGLFITGVNTEVGKTYVTAMIAKTLAAAGVRVGVYKPAASGCELRDHGLVSEDAEILWNAAGKPLSLEAVCPQCFQAPLAPHVAARAECRELSPALLRSGLEAWKDFEVVLVEGAGGLMSPMGDEDYVADLAEEFGFPLIVVAPNTLGVINQTLQTLITAAAFREGLPVAGVVLNDVVEMGDLSAESNRQELEARCVPPILAHVKYGAERFEEAIDWKSLCGSPNKPT